ncbi:hypothetical protein [Evansella tamaricis]|uniref:Uncharacterized protein n=1 Tax=Evansella tamaricis TaxID=2069301 RepID=A0ABS6JAH4_9BACI|nr:hypothetical protein [Evansella tamaricis]MBU9710620.1 hypothetical protein [Evansella tamaricis]
MLKKSQELLTYIVKKRLLLNNTTLCSCTNSWRDTYFSEVRVIFALMDAGYDYEAIYDHECSFRAKLAEEETSE